MAQNHTPPLRSALRHSARSPSPTPVTPAFSPILSPTPLTPSLKGGRLPLTTTPSSSSNLPVPPGYTPKVSFDTFENPIQDALFSFTLQTKSEGYKRTRRTRVFLCAASPDESGEKALEWALECLVQDDDEFVVVRGFDSIELDKDHEEIREEARQLMRQIKAKNVEVNGDRKLSIVVEFVAGKITDTIEKMIALYRPDSLIVGTRGEKTFLRTVGAAIGTSIGSVSKYCLSHSPVPVIVVQPHRRKAMEKRRADPKRKSQFELLTTVPQPVSSSKVSSP